MKFVSVFFLSIIAATVSGQTPENCFSQKKFLDLIKCLTSFIPQANSLSDTAYHDSLPTNQQISDWKQLINQVLNSNGNCDKLQIPQSFQNYYKIKKFVEKNSRNDDGQEFCILFEITTVNKNNAGTRFQKGWGIFATPFSKKNNQLMAHYSAAHPFTDGSVELQAAAIFQKTQARSMLISGLRRNSSIADSLCQPGNYRTDAAHDNNTMFHHTLIATQNWQFQTTSGRLNSETCTWSNCLFLQFHGKASSSCTNDTIFLSNGYSDSNAYSNADQPVIRLQNAWRKNAPKNWTANTPVETKCNLSGTTNIFGRLMNGVPSGNECSQKAKVDTMSGFFIHVEQATEARDKGAYDVWTQSILDAFGS